MTLLCCKVSNGLPNVLWSALKRDPCIPLCRHIRGHSTTSSSSTALDLQRKWQERWKNSPNSSNSSNKSKGKYSIVSMFPYPSGNMHVGHLRVYTITDVIARYKRMKGYDVMYPMGWDAFGLPAENAAIDRGVQAAEWTYSNIANMKRQMDLMLADCDWDREVVTCSPEYYKWTQKLFLMLFENGLAYRKKAEVNWDPVEKTVLANEQVDAQGRSWRSGALVEKKFLEQWFLGITKYADRLIADLDILDQWPKKIKTMQYNWIGPSKGANIVFKTVDQHKFQCFTTRPDTLYGVSYIALSLNHDVAKHAAQKDTKLAKFLEDAANLPDDSKAGIQIPGLYVSNPLKSPNVYDIPVYVAPYVLSGYGEGVVMGCPAHDERDRDFWLQNNGSTPLKVVEPLESLENTDNFYSGKEGVLNSNCGPFAGLSTKDGAEAIVKALEASHSGQWTTQLRLRDWLISRQRFWGAPIPIVHCKTCGPVAVPDEELPVKLPEGVNTPLAQQQEFLDTECPKCHGPAQRDSDTMDTFMDSAWYLFRYTDPKNTEKIFDFDKASERMPIDFYSGGIEHATLHLLYVRFIAKFLQDIGCWSGGDMKGEPIRQLVSQGMVQGKTFIEPTTGKFLKPYEVETTSGGPKIKSTGVTPLVAFEKMSKSKFNGVDPEEVVKQYGADAARAYILFQAPVNDPVNWDEAKIVGIQRWIGRFHSVVAGVCSKMEPGKVYESISDPDDELTDSEKAYWNEIQTKLQQVDSSLGDTLALNTVISDYMKLTRTLMEMIDNTTTDSNIALLVEATRNLIQIVSPVIPANAEEAWEQLLTAQRLPWQSIFSEEWPEARDLVTVQKTTQHSVVVNGKRLFMLENFDESTDEQGIINLVLNHEKGSKALEGKTVTKVLVPQGKSTVVLIAK